MRVVGLFVVVGLGLGLGLACGGRSAPVRAGAIRIPVSRDTTVSAYAGEQEVNLGGARKLKAKGVQELVLLDADLSAARGRVIDRARLIVHSRSPDAVLDRVTLSTLATDWTEGGSMQYRPQEGSACFLWAELGKRRWAGPGSDLTSVCNGLGNTIFAFSKATPPDAHGWQQIPVDPRIVAARAVGLSSGFVLTDDIGSEYVRDGEQVRLRLFRNRYIASREGGERTAPFFELELGAEDRQVPGPVRAIRSSTLGEEPGDALLEWGTPGDDGPAGVLGFLVRRADRAGREWTDAVALPRHMIPLAPEPGRRPRMRLRGAELGLGPGAHVRLGIRAVDAAGNVGPVAWAEVETAPADPTAELAPAPEIPRATGGANPRLGGDEVFVLDPLDKLDPSTGETIPAHPPAYRVANHLWSGPDRRVRLQAARNETVGLNLVVAGTPQGLALEPEIGAPLRARWFRYGLVRTPRGLLPDPLVEPERALPLRPGLSFVPLYLEIHVPRGAKPGTHAGRVVLRAGEASLTLELEVRVWDFLLPDRLSFVPQMNCYGLPPPPAEISWYRLAHEHRTCLNRLPYGWRGQVRDGCGPEIDERGEWHWEAYDARFGPLLDGGAFADLPRAGVPVDAFYLPLNENWPASIESGFSGGYWPDEALAPEYRMAFVDGCRRFADHFRERGWNSTVFEFYLNNKVERKREGWSRTTAPWTFDEPVNTQDFVALRWYGNAFHEGVRGAGSVRLAFRTDVSRPEWQRDLLDGVADVYVVGGAFWRYRRRVLERKRTHAQIVYNYGTTNRVEKANTQPVLWSLESWCAGLDGIIPWQTVGKRNSWEDADPLALLYPAADHTPRPSIRLKAYRRGQQDVEYLVLLSSSLGLPRRSLERLVREELGLRGSFVRTDAADAGRREYAAVDPAALWALRARIGATLDALKPGDVRDR